MAKTSSLDRIPPAIYPKDMWCCLVLRFSKSSAKAPKVKWITYFQGGVTTKKDSIPSYLIMLPFKKIQRIRRLTNGSRHWHRWCDWWEMRKILILLIPNLNKYWKRRAQMQMIFSCLSMTRKRRIRIICSLNPKHSEY